MRTTECLCLLEDSPEETRQRTFAFTISCGLQTAVVGLLLAEGLWFPHRVQVPRRVTQYAVITLPSFPPEQKPILKPPPLPKVGSREKGLPELVAPPVVPAPKAGAPVVEKPEIPVKLPAVDTRPREQPATVAVAQPILPLAPAVHTGLFNQLIGHAESTRTPLRNIETGGFGHPQGLPGDAPAGSPGNPPKVGAFDTLASPSKVSAAGSSPERPRTVVNAGFAGSERYTMADIDERNQRIVRQAGFAGSEQYTMADIDERNQQTVRQAGFGGGEHQSVTDSDEFLRRKAVANAGFGSGGVAAGVNNATGRSAPVAVKTDSFGATPETAQAPAKPRAAPAAPKIRPVEILSKPLPQYTEEARRLHVQGEVVLSVIFQANGTLKVLRVIQSLGHGLDQMAEQAASQIRFKPAAQADKPMDFPATLHIEFRLA